MLTIKSGDVINYHNKSGGPHNVSFWADSIPAGAAAVLGASMPNQMQPLSGSMIVEQDAIYTVSFAGAPAGEYKFYCLPHLAMGMKGVLTVTRTGQVGGEVGRPSASPRFPAYSRYFPPSHHATAPTATPTIASIP